MRVAVAVAMTMAMMGGLRAVSAAEPLASDTPKAKEVMQKAMKLEIAAQPIDDALNEFARQSRLQVFLLASNDTQRIRSARVSGIYEPRTALSQMLADTGLSYEQLDARSFAVVDATSKRAAAAPADEESKKASGPTQKTEDADGAPPVVAPGHAQPGREDEAGKSPGRDSARSYERVEEIVVSAQKKGDERLLDVPIPVSALDGAKLAEMGQVMLRDYAAHIPGFRASPDPFGGAQLLSIRGVTTGTGNPTVGVAIDDVPYGGSAGRLAGTQVPDIDPGDLSRVEVLRGPQGTLYGAASMGGLVKFVTRDPSTAGYSGRLEAGISSVRNGNDPGYNFRAAANVPLSDSLAFRVSGFTRTDAGYIDNPLLGRDGLNETTSEGGRISALWRPSDAFSLKLSALYQHTDGGAATVYVLPGLGDLQRNGIPTDGDFSKLNRAYSMAINARIGGLLLTSLTGYSDLRTSDSLDYNAFLAPSRTQAQFGVSGAALHSYFTNDRFVQEIRLAGPIGQKFEWLLGAFYDDEEGPYDQRILAHDARTGAIAGEWAHYINPGTLEEYAGFANLTYHVTDRFDFQVGGRQSHSRFDMGDVIQTGPLTGQVTPVIVPGQTASTSAFTYLVTPRFKVSDDLMLYARFSSGYRPGGPNRGLPNMPTAYQSDKTKNYEIGLKGRFLDDALVIDTSIYAIDWKDIQIQLANAAGFSYFTNASRARSDGVELSVESRPFTGTTLTGWLTYNDASLTDAFPPGSTAYGVSGDALPFGSKWSGNVSLRQDFRVSANATCFVEGVVTYVGERLGLFTRTPVRQIYPSYTETSLRAGLTHDSWTASLYANNITDRRALIGGGVGLFPAYSYFYTQPRTVGLTVSKTFE